METTNFRVASTPKDKPNMWKKLAITAAAIAGLLIILAGINQVTDGKLWGGQSADSAKWQAIFLTNGQVYFGHIDALKEEIILLKDIYYLQVERKIQPPEPNQNVQLSLGKLGRFELHCPEDKMTISRDQVLFWEDLKPDSKVVKAIDAYLKTNDINKACYEAQATS